VDVPEWSKDAVSASIVVAMDGPSGSGKSSTSRGVAGRLGLRYLDTGAMYRAVTWWMLQHGIDVDDAEAVAAHAAEPVLESGTDPAHPTITVDGVDVAGPIRSAEVTRAVSAVSAVPQVRSVLLRQQRAIIGDDGGIVVEGRDIGTVVAPDAPVKVFLTADADARAVRRTAEIAGGPHAGADQVSATQADLIRRDRLDSGRAASPLTMAEDAHHIDTTGFTLEQVIDQVVALVEAAESRTRA
jgi:cytidylate kinase